MTEEECFGKEKSFVISDDQKSITFLPCQTISHHPMDIAHRYCSKCEMFLDEDNLRNELWAEILKQREIKDQ